MSKVTIIEGRVSELGSVITDPNGMTTWSAIRITKSDGSDEFLPPTKCSKEISSYVRDSLGQYVRLYFIQLTINKTTEGAIVGIQFENGRSYDVGSELDEQVRGLKSTLRKLTFVKVCLAIIAAISAFSVIGLIITVPICFGLWKTRNSSLGSLLDSLPTSKEFKEFYDVHRQIKLVDPEVGQKQLDEAKQWLDQVLLRAITKNFSTFIIEPNSLPTLNIDGAQVEVSNAALTQSQALNILHCVMTDVQAAEFARNHKISFEINLENIGQFHVAAVDIAGFPIITITRNVTPATELAEVAIG